MPIKFIKARRGKNTTHCLLDMIKQYPEGITIKALSLELNRPVSMVNICLKLLISSRKIKVKMSQNGMQRLYIPYPKNDICIR